MSTATGIQGTLGEALVAELFRRNGWVVRHFGVEHHLAVLPGQDVATTGSGHVLAAMPDLLVARPDKEDPRALFVEVKTGAEPTVDQAQPYRSFGTILLVHVSASGIRAAWFFGHRHRGALRFEPIEARDTLRLEHVEEFHEAARQLLGMMDHVRLAAGQTGLVRLSGVKDSLRAPGTTPWAGMDLAPYGRSEDRP